MLASAPQTSLNIGSGSALCWGLLLLPLEIHRWGGGALPGRHAQTATPTGVPGVPKGAEPDAAVQEKPDAP